MYALLGLLALLCRRNDRDPVPILIFLAVAMMSNGIIRHALGHTYYESYWRTDVRGASILAGAIAFLLVKRHNLLARIHGMVPVGLGALSIVLNLGRVPDPVKYSAGTICLSFCLALLPSAPSLVMRILDNALLRGIGLISFSLYLWQQVFFEYGREHFGTFYSLIGVSLALLAGLLSYLLIEKTTRPLTLKLFSRASSRLA